jgi:proline iminopeptidase
VTVTADDGVTLWTTRSGHGRPAVLMDGGPGIWDYLESLAELVDSLFSAVRYDQRGCGRSGGADGPYTLDRATADLDAVRTAADAGPTFLVGHSWGATLALLYALERPDSVEGVVYCAGTGLEWARWKPSTSARLVAGTPATRTGSRSSAQSAIAAPPRSASTCS